jgi:hypothetical protein
MFDFYIVAAAVVWRYQSSEDGECVGHVEEYRMAGIYLSKCEPEYGRRDFHLADKPLHEIVGQYGFKPEDREPSMPEQ